MPEGLLNRPQAPESDISNDPNPPSSAPIVEEESLIDLEAVALELLAHWKTILQVGIGALVVAAIIAFVYPPYYTAVASFIPPASNSAGSAAGIAASLDALGASSLLGPIKNPGELYVGILKSRSVADRMVDRFELQKVYRKKKRSLAEKALLQHSTFETDTKSPIISIKVTDHSPERARDMANAYLQEMKTVSGSLALTESSQRRLFFETRLAKEKDDLANAEVSLKQSEEATGLIAPAGQTISEIQAIAQVRAEITGREVQLASLAQAATAENPDVVRLQSEIQNLQKQLEQMEFGTSRNQSHGIPTSKVPSLELEYIRKAREVKYHEALFNIIAKQYEAARLDEANSSPILQVLDQATVPDMRSGPPRLVIMLAGFIVGLFGGSIWVLYRARKKDYLR